MACWLSFHGHNNRNTVQSSYNMYVTSIVTDKWSPLLVVIYIYLFLKSNTSSLMLPCSLAVLSLLLSLLLCPSLYFSLYQPPGPLFKGKGVGPTCGQEPRAHSTCQLPSSFLRLSGAYIVQNPNYYLNIIILLKTKSTN